MERSDFSVPRRMSKSAFIILLVKELLSYAGPFLIWAIIKLFNPAGSVPLWKQWRCCCFCLSVIWYSL